MTAVSNNENTVYLVLVLSHTDRKETKEDTLQHQSGLCIYLNSGEKWLHQCTVESWSKELYEPASSQYDSSQGIYSSWKYWNLLGFEIFSGNTSNLLEFCGSPENLLANGTTERSCTHKLSSSPVVGKLSTRV